MGRARCPRRRPPYRRAVAVSPGGAGRDRRRRAGAGVRQRTTGRGGYKIVSGNAARSVSGYWLGEADGGCVGVPEAIVELCARRTPSLSAAAVTDGDAKSSV